MNAEMETPGILKKTPHPQLVDHKIIEGRTKFDNSQSSGYNSK